MDEAKRKAIEACGRPGCGYPQDAHKNPVGTDDDALGVLAALGGPCTKFVASDAAVILQKYLAITNNRAPRYQPGRIGKRLPLHQACGNRHPAGSCPLLAGPAPAEDTAARGAAKARERLGLTSKNDSKEGS